MYKCKECGAEYDIKPDYCDCGNDEFEEIVSFKKAEEISSINQQDRKNEGIVYETSEVQPAIKPSEFVPKQEKSFAEQYSFIRSVDPVSLIIFCLCIFLSIYVIFFAWNPKEDSGTKIKTSGKSGSVIIPNIDKFWDNTPPKIEEKKTTVQVKPVEIIPPVVKKVISTPKPVQNKTTQTKKQTTTVPLKKITKTQKTPVTNTKAQEQAKKAAEEAAKKAAEEAAKQKAAEMAAAEAQAKKLAEEQARKAAQERARQAAAAKQELVNYKANLRNTLGRKIDFTKVIGDGSCTVTFRIDGNGKLINRSFAQQSANITLNDAVYKAVMATPSYNPPPSAYNNEMLNLYIKFYNGNFEISLP